MKKRKMTLTGLVKKEGNQYAALCLELDVASCGDTQAEAIAALRDAIDTYVEYMVTERREQEIYRPVPVDALREFLTGAEKPRQQEIDPAWNVGQHLATSRANPSRSH